MYLWLRNPGPRDAALELGLLGDRHPGSPHPRAPRWGHADDLWGCDL